MASLMCGGMKRAVVVFTIGSLGILVVVPSALGQAAIDQYVPAADPAEKGKDQQGSGAGSGGKAAAPLGTEGANTKATKNASAGSEGGGDLPGTDYPVTAFVLVILALVAVALLVKFAWPALERRFGSGNMR
jgi:hypothetical protein